MSETMTEAEMQSRMRRDAEAENRTLRARVAELERENSVLRGITPDLGPRPPDGAGMPRFGLRWNGPTTPLPVPMDDGYWTPWHLAQKRVTDLETALSALLDAAERQAAGFGLPAEEWFAVRDCASAALAASVGPTSAPPARVALTAALHGFMAEHDECPGDLPCSCELCAAARSAIGESGRREPCAPPLAPNPPVCETCLDTHRMALGEREVPCAKCPVPCEECRADGYCKATPCNCVCHQRGAAGKEASHG